MNNSKIAMDNLEEPTSKVDFLEREMGKLAQIAEAIKGVESSDDWKKFKRLVLDGVVESLEKRLIEASSKKDVDLAEVYRIQGEILWANKYVDLKKFSEWYTLQIEHIKNQLNEKDTRHGGL